jgi:hypothetical protein
METPGVGTILPSLELLHARGHRLELAYQVVKSVESRHEVESFAARCPGTTFHELPPPSRSRTTALASWLRRSIDYLRYLEPPYRDAAKLRQRARRKAPKAMRRAGRVAQAAGPRGVAALRRTLQALEACLPPAPEVVRFLEEHRPDVLIPTHLLPIGTPHADYLRAAKRLGIRTVFPVRGWDNLTNKGLLRDVPDAVLVWNDLQATEAVELHQIPPGRITVVGAALCDAWFDWSPSRSREDFCRTVGLRPDRPIVLYVCSSGFVARREVGFVREWIRELRSRGGPLAEAGFLVRPHPLNAAQWTDADLGDPNARVWPRFGEAPHDDESRRNFYDSIFHADAVVGINTTAQIESAIVGRPVHTLLADEFRQTQQGTLHFHYLKADEFGLLFVGRDFDEHAEQLAESLRGRVADGRNERFLRRFVRPRGLDRPARELIVEAIEELGAGAAPAPRRGPLLSPIARVALVPLMLAVASSDSRRRERRTGDATPVGELRRVVRKRVLHRTGAPVVAGPWLEDEVGELLYWIPFLRGLQASRTGVRERLFVVSRSSSASWYDGIGAESCDLETLVDAGAAGGLPGGTTEVALHGPLRERVAEAFRLGSRAFRVLPPELVVDTRSELSELRPTAQGRRMLEFALLPPGAPPAGLDLPAEYVAVQLGFDRSELGTLLAERQPVVRLDAIDRPRRQSVIARAGGYVGGFGPEAVLAVLSGVAAVVLPSGIDVTVEDDVRFVRSFLGAAPFGPLYVLDETLDPDQAADRVSQLLEAPVEALAAV